MLGVFAVYTALIGDSTPLIGVAQAATGEHAGDKVLLTGKVISFSGDASTDAGLVMDLRDHETGDRLTVRYHGSVPDAFRVDRSVVVEGVMGAGEFTAADDTLVTKCPSKYAPPTSGATTAGA